MTLKLLEEKNALIKPVGACSFVLISSLFVSSLVSAESTNEKQADVEMAQLDEEFLEYLASITFDDGKIMDAMDMQEIEQGSELLVNNQVTIGDNIAGKKLIKEASVSSPIKENKQ